MPRAVRRTVLATLITFVLTGAGARASEPITVFAAASLAEAIGEVAAAFEAQGGPAVRVVLAGSSALARQILQGAPADIFVSANPGWMDAVEQAGRVVPGSRRDLLTNTLVLVIPAADRAIDAPPRISTAFDLRAQLGTGRLAMALTKAVPAGIYGRAALESLGLWAELAPRVVETDNVRAALALVATGAVAAGVVYWTDAAAEPRVVVTGVFPTDSHPPIRYPVAKLTTRDTPGTDAFLAYIGGVQAREIFVRRGFGVVAD